ncbi:MAG: thioredoxin family protein [Syntrophorhabdaceae bacterium]
MDELAQTLKGQAKLVKINVDNNPNLAARHNVRGVPAIFFYRNGAIADQAVGSLPRNELEQRIRAII